MPSVTTDDIMTVLQEIMQMTSDGFVRLEGRMDGLDGRMVGLEDQMNKLDGRMGTLEQSGNLHTVEIKKLNDRLDKI